MKVPGGIDLSKFDIEVDKENGRIVITKKALSDIEKYFFNKVEQTGIAKKNLYKSAYLIAKWQLVYNTLQLFNEEENPVEQIAQHEL